MWLFLCRLIFLLQCGFKLLESCGDDHSAIIPLTLGSAVRKFTKQALRVNHNCTAYKQQVMYILQTCHLLCVQFFHGSYIQDLTIVLRSFFKC